MKQKFVMAALSLAALVGAAQPPEQKYAEGQVWEYKTRPGDRGSLLKIQRIESVEAFAVLGPVYHISVVGLHFPGLPVRGELPHAPVSRQTLDASVTRLSKATVEFPDPAPGIQQWRAARGGVFTIPVSDVASFVEQTIRQQSGPQS